MPLASEASGSPGNNQRSAGSDGSSERDRDDCYGPDTDPDRQSFGRRSLSQKGALCPLSVEMVEGTVSILLSASVFALF